jgi:hypothetical protein
MTRQRAPVGFRTYISKTVVKIDNFESGFGHALTL